MVSFRISPFLLIQTPAGPRKGGKQASSWKTVGTCEAINHGAVFHK